MTEPNPFSTVNSLNHLVNPKIVSDGATGYQIQVDIANVDTFYGRQLGGTANQFAQAYIQQIGTTGFPSQQAFFQQIGTTGISGQAYFNTIGSTGSSGDAYFNTVHWKAFDPPLAILTAGGVTLQEGAGIELVTQPSGQFINSRIFGGPGISVNSPANGQPYIISSTGNKTIIGSTGIRVDVAGSTYTLSSSIAVTGSPYITVQQNGATFTINYTGSQASGAPSGVSGSYAVFDSTGTISSSTVLTASNVVGTTGQVMLYSAAGPTGSSLLALSGRTLYTPTIVVHDPTYANNAGKYLRLTADFDSSYIQSGNTENANSSAPLQISGYYGGPILTTFDIPQGKVTINPGAGATYNYPYGVRLVGASSVSQTVFYPGGTYNVHLWGGGGSGALFPGGAGGYVKIQNIFGASGVTFGFNNAASAVGGGNAMGLFVNGVAAAVAPGGGVGGFRGPGAAYGEPGGSYPGQGYSALNGAATGGVGGTYLQASFGSNNRYYTLGQNYVGTGATFTNVPVTYGTTGTIVNGSVITVLGTNVTLNSTTGLYTFGNGGTLIFNTPGMTFINSLYGLTGITYGFFDSLTIGVTAGVSGIFPGFTGITGNTNGFATFDPLIPASIATTGALVGGTFQNYTGSVGLSGNTYTVATNSTLQLTPGSIFNTNGSISTITLNTDDAFAFSQSLGGTVVTARLTGVTGTSGSVVQVGTTFGIVYGQNGSSTVGGSSGGGGGFYGGGGGVAGGGGGAGSAIIQPGFTGVTGAGSGRFPFPDTYNLAGAYGFGGSGGAGGLPYYVIERVDTTLKPDVLQVNGNETVAGTLTVQNGAIIQGTGNVLTTFGSILSSGAVQAPDYVGINPALTAVQVANFSQGISGTFGTFSGLITGNAGITATAGNFTGRVDARIVSTAYSPTGVFGFASKDPSLNDSPAAFPFGITCAGYVNINTPTGGGPGLIVSAAGISTLGNVTANNVVATSDMRLKHNVVTIDSSLEKVLKLRGVYFNRLETEKRNLGVIAQEIEEILPEVVYTDSDGMKSVAYGNIVGLLIEAIKEQQEMINKLI
jgi:hypothetical protein